MTTLAERVGDVRQARAAGVEPFWDRPFMTYRVLVGSAGLLTAIGLVMVFSASSVSSYGATGNSFDDTQKQALILVPGVFIAYFLSRRSIAFYKKAGPVLLVFCVVALMAVLVPGIGTSILGARRWINVGVTLFQPSEPAKVAMALWGALVLSRVKDVTYTQVLLMPLLPVTALVGGLIILEPDYGTTVSLLVVVVTLLFVVGAPLRVFGVFLGVLLLGLAVLAVAEPYRVARLTSFLHPLKDSGNAGYQASQGLYGLSSGGVFGVGLGASREKWNLLPHADTDYIFAIIGEELGLIGATVVIILFAVLGVAGFQIARRQTDAFARLAAASVTAWIVGQALINMGYVVGLLPVTGVPLPLISSGGTSLLVTLCAVAMLAAFSRAEPVNAAIIEAGGGSWLRRRPQVAQVLPGSPRAASRGAAKVASRRRERSALHRS